MNRTAFSVVAVWSIAAFAGFEGGLPDETHAWGMNDDRIPQPSKVDNDFGGVPSDALVFGSADGIGRDLASDCQLHFCCRSLDGLSCVCTELAPAATPGADGWIVVDAVLHAGSEGHDGYVMVFVNGVFSGEAVVKGEAGAKPLVVSGKGVCRIWARSTPPPWAERLCGAYVDRAAVAEKRRATAEHLLVVLAGMRERLPGNRWGEGRHGFARRRVEAAITAYAYCREAKFEKVFRAECDAYAALALSDTERKTYAKEGNLLTLARLLFPFVHEKTIDGEFPLWKVIRDMGVKPWR